MHLVFLFIYLFFSLVGRKILTSYLWSVNYVVILLLPESFNLMDCLWVDNLYCIIPPHADNFNGLKKQTQMVVLRAC